MLESIESIRAKNRMSLGKKLDPVDELSLGSEQGRTRDIIAAKIKLKSGRQYERARNVINKIDQLKEDGKTEEADIMINILNQAPSTAEEFISKVDITIKRKLQSSFHDY